MKNFIFALLLCALALPLFAQNTDSKLGIDFTIRPRTEFRNGSFTLRPDNVNPAFFTSSRNRMGLSFSEGPLELRFAVQNVTVWGQSPQIETGASTMLNEAWVKYALNDAWKLQFGRQQIAYDDDRILGTLEWHQSGRWHDALFLKHAKESSKLDIGLAFNQNNERVQGTNFLPGGQPYKSMQMLHYQNAPTAALSYSILALNLGKQSVDNDTGNLKDAYLFTFGGNMKYAHDAFTFGGTAYIQRGEENYGQSAEGFLLATYLSKQFDNINWLVGLDVLSGNDLGVAGGDASFNPLYGTHHKFYGLMDYFYVGNGHSDVGLVDYHTKVSIKQSEKFSYGAAIHAFQAQGDLGVADQYLGTEIDLTFNYKWDKYMSLQGGYSQMFAADNMELIKGVSNPSGNQSWVWLMLKVSPSFMF
jgi:hypothetical protein